MENKRLEIETMNVEELEEILLNESAEYELKLAWLEGVRSGSMGGHDPDFMKLNKGLRNFWIKKARTHPHPFTYCVRHLTGKVKNPKRLCAWLKDQALGTTRWRNQKESADSDDPLDKYYHEWSPDKEDLVGAIEAFVEAQGDINEILTKTLESYEESQSSE